MGICYLVKIFEQGKIGNLYVNFSRQSSGATMMQIVINIKDDLGGKPSYLCSLVMYSPYSIVLTHLSASISPTALTSFVVKHTEQ